MTPQEFVAALREEFVKQLESTGSYTKAGMTLAFERAVTAALLRYATPVRFEL